MKINRSMLYVFWIIFISFLSLYGLQDKTIPFIFNDEYAYWSSGAYFAGYDWSGITSQMAYYSYGYGFLLAFLLKLFSDTILAYKLAICLNTIWLIMEFILLTKIGCYLFPKTDKESIILLSGCSVCYCSNVAQVNYTWPEVFISFLFVLISYLIISVYEKATSINVCFLVCISGYYYMVHSRNIVILISVIVFLFVCMLTKRMSLKMLMVSITGVICILLISMVFKEIIVSNVWLDGKEVAINSMPGQIGKIKSLLSADGFCDLLISLGGKLYYIVLSSLGFVVISFIHFCQRIIHREKHWEISLFLCLSFLGSLGVSALFMLKPLGATHLVYGRYSENVIVVFVFVGLIVMNNIFTNKNNLHYFIGMVIGISFLSIILNYCQKKYSLNGVAAINNIGIFKIVESDQIAFETGSLFFVIILLIFLLIRNKNSYFIGIIAAMVWIFIGKNAVKSFEDSNWKQAQKDFILCSDKLQETEHYEEFNVYALKIGNAFATRFTGNGIQFLLPDLKIISLNEDALNEVMSINDLVIIPSYYKESWNYERIYETETYSLLVKTKEKLE